MSAASDEVGAPMPSRACRVHRFGPPEVISLEDVGIAAPASAEVLVRVAAAGVGPWDGWIRAGRSVLPQPLPLTLGSDLSGVVAAVGSGVTGFAIGDPVFGVTNMQFTGAYADYALARADMIAIKPAGLEYAEAAAVPVVATTAWQALFGQARLDSGQTVLAHGASGSVGSFAVQLARWAGMRVIATGRAKDAARLRALGADATIDTDAARFEATANNVDTVIDLVGGDLQASLFAVLKRGGMFISAVALPDQACATERGIKATFFLVDVTTERLARIAAMLAAGALHVAIGEILPLAEARVAHEMLDGTRLRPRGKIVLRAAD
jgi:NADPH:quinone reductase-like Zn-dependent oxidoreductase